MSEKAKGKAMLLQLLEAFLIRWESYDNVVY